MGRGGRLLLRRAAAPRRHCDAAQGALDGRPAPALRGDRVRAGQRRAHPATLATCSAASLDGIRSCSRASIDRRRPPRERRPRHPRSILDETSCARAPRRMLDEDEFLSPYGIRAALALPPRAPYSFWVGGQEYPRRLPARRVGHGHVRRQLELARADLVAGQHPDPPRAAPFYAYYGDAFTGRVPDRLGNEMKLFEVAGEIAARLTTIFLRDEDGRRPVFGGAETFQDDPHWHDHLLFYEYFHGDNGAGLGASHQTAGRGLWRPSSSSSAAWTAHASSRLGLKPVGAGRKGRLTTMTETGRPTDLYRTETVLRRALRVRYPLPEGRIVLRTDLDWDHDLEAASVSDDGTTFTFTARGEEAVPLLQAAAGASGPRRAGRSGANGLVLMTAQGARDVYPYFSGSENGTFSPAHRARLARSSAASTSSGPTSRPATTRTRSRSTPCSSCRTARTCSSPTRRSSAATGAWTTRCSCSTA